MSWTKRPGGGIYRATVGCPPDTPFAAMPADGVYCCCSCNNGHPCRNISHFFTVHVFDENDSEMTSDFTFPSTRPCDDTIRDAGETACGSEFCNNYSADQNRGCRLEEYVWEPTGSCNIQLVVGFGICRVRCNDTCRYVMYAENDGKEEECSIGDPCACVTTNAGTWLTPTYCDCTTTTTVGGVTVRIIFPFITVDSSGCSGGESCPTKIRFALSDLEA